jgi:hypothetical protein
LGQGAKERDYIISEMLKSAGHAARIMRAPMAQRTILTATAFKLAKSVMPKMSETEKVALGCGTVGFDQDIFTGSPSLQHLLDTYKPTLSAEETSFLNNEVEELCTMLNDYQVTTNKDLPAEAWEYMRYVHPLAPLFSHILSDLRPSPGI